jgi:hypothetical protein
MNETKSVLQNELRNSGEGMRIAVSTQGKDLEAQVDSRFGRASNLILNDREANMKP